MERVWLSSRTPGAHVRAHLTLALALTFLAGCGGVLRFGQLDPPEGRQMIVGVYIEGNDALSDGAIADALATHADNFSLSEDKPLLERPQLPTDARRIESFYAASGYFDARVREWRVDELDEHRVHVYFRVREGQPTRIVELDFGDRLVTYASEPEARERLRAVEERLRDLVPLRVGEVWTELAYEEGKARLRTALREQGFLYTEVIGDVFVDRESHEAFVYYSIVPGPLTRIGSISVKGADDIPASRILRRVALKPGDIVLPARLRETERDIYDLRVFFGVSVVPKRRSLREELDGQAATLEALRAIEWDDEVVIEISVQEMPIHELVTGIGTTIDNLRGEAYGRAGYRNRNFIGGLRFLDTQARGALVALPGFTDPDAEFAPGVDVSLLLRQPSFLEEYLELSGRVSYELGVDYGYHSHKVDFGPALSRRFFHYITVTLAYRVIYYEYFDISGALELDLGDTLGLDFRETYLLTYLEQVVEFDTRDVIYDPRKGLYGALRLAESAKALGSDFDYIRLSLDLRAYWTPARWLTLAVAFRYGQAFDLYGSDIPLPARFKAGGPSDMRGFGAGRMGPYLCQLDDGTQESGSDDTSCDGSKVFIGGDLLLEANLELRFYLPLNFGLVAFVDVGEVWPEADNVDLAEINVAVGPGIRYFTPFGPIRLDFGFLVTQPKQGAFTFHFSIGQAF